MQTQSSSEFGVGYGWLVGDRVVLLCVLMWWSGVEVGCARSAMNQAYCQHMPSLDA